jgi:uncharacterized protein with HEPN domain
VSRDWRLRWLDILEACRRVQRYTAGLSFDDFQDNELVYDAVTRNLEIIGEAVTAMPADVLATEPEIDWAKVKGFRVMAAHLYHRLDPAIVWNVVEEHIPKLLACNIGDLPAGETGP